MDSKYVKFLCLFSLALTVTADSKFADNLENVARSAFRNHYPTYTFEKLESQNIDLEANLIDFLIISSRTDPSDDSSSASSSDSNEFDDSSGTHQYLLCSLKIKLDSIDRLMKDPHVESGACNAQSSHATARQTGGVRDVHLIYNVTEEEMGLVNEMADFAAQKLDEIDADDRKNFVEEVLNPTKQFAGGILYAFTLRLSESSCPENTNDNDACGQSTGKPVKLCDVKVLRTWAVKNSPQASLVESHCEPEYEALLVSDRKSKQFRTVVDEESSTPNSNQQLLGGLTEVDVNDEKVLKYATESLATLSGLSESTPKLGLIRVVSAKAQVVSGLLYFLKLEVGHSKCPKGSKTHRFSKCKDFSGRKICNVQVWVQEWLDSVRVTDASCENKLSESRKKRSAQQLPSVSTPQPLGGIEVHYQRPLGGQGRSPIVGGLTPANINNADVQRIAKFSLSSLESQSGSPGSLQLVEVTEAYTQVVAGKMYHLTLKVSDSKGDSKTCKVKVVEQVWISNVPKFVEGSCEDKPLEEASTPPVPGGLTPVDINNVDVQRLAKFSVSSLENQSGSPGSLQLVEVTEAYKQVVAGTMYHLTLKVSSSKGDSKTCKVKVLERPWISKDPQIVEGSCEDKPLSEASTPPVPGGLTPVDVNNVDVQRIAKFSVSSLESQSGSPDSLQLVEVTEAYKQVVAGIMYHLTLKVSSWKGDSKTCKVKVLEQPWISQVPQFVEGSCEDKPLTEESTPVPVFGGLTPVDVNNADVRRIAKFSLSSLESQSGSSGSLQLVEVTEAFKQIVAGTMYHLTLKVSSSKGDSKTCKVKVVEQTWVSPNPKFIEGSCEDKPLEGPSTPFPLLGGLKSVDVNGEDVQRLARFSLASLAGYSEPGSPLRLVKVTEAHTQVVSGLMHHLTLEVANSRGKAKMCKVKVLEQLWISPNPKVTHASCEDKPLSRRKRSLGGSGKPPTLGGLKPVDVNNVDVQRLAKFSLSSLESQSGSPGSLKLVEVTEAHKQVVAGTMYHLTLKVSSSKGDSKTCKVKVVEQPWVSPNPTFVEGSCEDKPLLEESTTVPVLGGLTPFDVNDVDVQRIAKFSLSSLESQSGSPGSLKLVKVTEAYKQVVSGTMYHLTLKVSSSKGDSKICKVKVVEQTWVSKDPKFIEGSCEDKPSNKRKRSLGGSGNPTLGGLEPVDVKDAKVQNFAKFSLSSLESQSGSPGSLQLVEVTDAHTQVVAGTMYHLTLKVSTSKGDSKTCKVKVIEQAWVSPNPKFVDGSCEDKPLNRRKRSDQMVGGRKQVSLDDEDVLKYAKFSLSKLDDSGAEDKLELVKVIEAHVQTVSGQLYHLKFSAASPKGKSKACTAKVWVQRWADMVKVTDGACEDKPLDDEKRSIIDSDEAKSKSQALPPKLEDNSNKLELNKV